MSISSTLNKIRYNGNDSTTDFAFANKFDADSDLKVIVTDADGVDEVKSLNTHYTVAGAGTDAGGTISFLTAPATGQVITILRNNDITQEDDYSAYASIDPQTIENSLDTVVQQLQKLEDRVHRSFKYPDSEAVSNSGTLTDTIDSRKNKFLAFDDDGKIGIFDNSDIVPDVTYNTYNLVNSSVYQQGISVDSIQALKLYQTSQSVEDNGTALLSGYYAENDGGGGLFKLDLTAALGSTLADNGYIVSASRDNAGGNTYYWRRQNLDGIVNVKYYGAKGDGSNDDTAAVSASIAKLASDSNINGLYFPKGTYKVTSALPQFTKDNCRIFGNDSTIELDKADNKPFNIFDIYNSDNVIIQDLVFTGGNSLTYPTTAEPTVYTTNEAYSLIKFRNGNNLTLRNLNVSSTEGIILQANNTNYISVRDCYISTLGTAIELFDAKYTDIVNNTIYFGVDTKYYHGIYTGDDDSTYLNIHGNQLFLNPIGSYYNRGYAVFSLGNYLTVSDNKISSYKAVKFVSGEVKNNSIWGISNDAADDSCIETTGSLSSNTFGREIINNVIRSNARAIYCKTGRNVHIKDNDITFTESAFIDIDNGIYVERGYNDLVIDNNTFRVDDLYNPSANTCLIYISDDNGTAPLTGSALSISNNTIHTEESCSFVRLKNSFGHFNDMVIRDNNINFNLNQPGRTTKVAIPSSIPLVNFQPNAAGITISAKIINNTINTGSLTYTNSTDARVTASYFELGSASFATSASYSLSSSYSVSASYSTTASYVQTAQTASYVLNAVSASRATSAETASYFLGYPYKTYNKQSPELNGDAFTIATASYQSIIRATSNAGNNEIYVQGTSWVAGQSFSVYHSSLNNYTSSVIFEDGNTIVNGNKSSTLHEITTNAGEYVIITCVDDLNQLFYKS